ncbi:MAG: ice-binding family protein [Candidatus Bathyarchaeia archaeon]
MNQKISDERVVGNKNGRITLLVSALLLLTILFVAANNLAVNNVAAQTSPPLGAAAAYSLLGNSGVTCTGASHVSGDVGSYPTTSVSGFPSPCSVGPPGTLDQTDAPAAHAAAVIAYNDLTQPCTGNGGTPYTSGTDLTSISPLGTGVYCSAGSFALSGTLTLTGSGPWIFRTGLSGASTLSTSPNSKVVGGDPCDVWWQVSSSATLDDNTQMIGNILASASVTLDPGATLDGRALAVNSGADTLAGGNQVNGCVTLPVTVTITSTIAGDGTTTFVSTIAGTIIPEYPWGVLLLLILMLPVYMLLKRRSLSH